MLADPFRNNLARRHARIFLAKSGVMTMSPRSTDPQRKQPRAAGLMMPLDYMLAVMRDPTASEQRRDRMCIAAAQYCHPRACDYRKSKKTHQAEIASKAGVGTEWAGDLATGDWHQ
jgi:hypothetical protein